MGQDRDTNIALLIDFDNVALGARDARQRFDIKFLMQRVLEKGKILVKKAYADWHFYKEYMGPLHEAAIELIEIPTPRIEANKAIEVLTDGPASAEEARHIAAEPAYANLSELGLGVLGDFNLKPTGSILLDEKLGLHIAFGRSDHFGGSVGPDDFSSPDAVIHLDRVYIAETQPKVLVRQVKLSGPNLDMVIIRDGLFLEMD